MFKVYYVPPREDIAFSRPTPKHVYFWMFAAVVLVLVVAVFYLGQYIRILELNYGVAKYQRELENAYQENVSLKAELYRGRSLAQIGTLARERYGFAAPAPGQVIICQEVP